MINNRQNGRRRGRGGQQVRNGQPGMPDRGSRLDNRARGNAAQLLEKYKSLARDAQMQGDRVNTEYYLQFADHYFRVLSENRSRFEEQRPDQQRGRREEYRDDAGQDGNREDVSADEDGGDDRQRGYEGQGNGWDDGEDSSPEPNRYEPHRPEPNRSEPNRSEQRRDEPRRDRLREGASDAPRQTLQDEGERYQDRRPQRSRGGRPPEGNGVPRAGDSADAPAERIEVDRLPQGFGTLPPVDAAGDDDAPAPARRRAPRRPRIATPGAEL